MLRQDMYKGKRHWHRSRHYEVLNFTKSQDISRRESVTSTKMKLALAFLFGFVLVQCQPQVYNLNPKFFNPLLYNGPRALNSPSPYYVQNPQYGAIFFNPYGSLVDVKLQDYEENESRYNLNNVKFSPDESDRNFIPVPRLFLNFANTASSIPPVGQFLFRTVISTTVITTTIPSVLKCIPGSVFVDPAAQVPCARRRREIAVNHQDYDQKASFREALVPSSTEKVETTAIAKHDAVSSFHPFDLLSSKEEHEMEKRPKRFFNLLQVTTTITTYFFVTSTVPKVENIAADNQLKCIPEGYAVCA